MNVIHIDDSNEIRKLYQDMFTIDNHKIQSFENGKIALKKILENNYDLILLDMMMPDYSGINFLQDLQKEKSSELKKVVIVSALDLTESQRQELLDFGIHSIEEKPPNLHSLVEMQKNMVFK